MKEYKSYSEQISLLKSRGLLFKNEEAAKNILKNENYYFLINGYKELFIQSNEVFKPNTYFESIWKLYEFDRQLRSLILTKILPLENNIKSVSAHLFSKKYGINQYQYLRISTFDNFEDSYSEGEKIKPGVIQKLAKREFDIMDFISRLNREIKKYEKRNGQIRHYLEKHDYIPPWVLFPVLDFGLFARLIEKLKSDIKLEIGIEFGIDSTSVLDRFLTILCFFRNVSAHNIKTFDLNIIRSSVHKSEYYNFENYSKGKNKIFALLIIFKKMLPENEFIDFFEKFEIEVKKLETEIDVSIFEGIKNKMGLPTNWERIKNL